MSQNPTIILFTYPESVYGRRIDWYLTLRSIKYYHCRVLNRLPRPSLEELGVGYRRIPILAIGRDIYCDTRLIIEKLESLFPANTLGATTPYQKGIQKLLETWTIDGGVFGRTAQLIPSNAALVKDPKWLEDRFEMSGRRWTPETMDENRPEALAHVRTHFGVVENALMADGREWVLGTPELSLADIHGIWPFHWALQPWMTDTVSKEVLSEDVFPKTFAWVKRFEEAYSQALERNGTPETLEEKEAVERILSAEYFDPEVEVDPADPLGLEKGQEVDIWPTDMASGFVHRDKGKLVVLTVGEVAIEAKSKSGRDLRTPHETSIQLNGSSKITVAADRATIPLQIYSEGTKQRKVADEVRQTTDEILTLLRPLTVPPNPTLSVNTFSSQSYPRASLLGETTTYASSITVTAEFRSLSPSDPSPNRTVVPGSGFHHLSLALSSLTKLPGTKIEYLKWFISPERLASLQSEARQNAMSESVTKISDYVSPMQFKFPLVWCSRFQEEKRYKSLRKLQIRLSQRDPEVGDAAIMYGGMSMHNELEGGGYGYVYVIEQQKAETFGLEPARETGEATKSTLWSSE